MSTFTIEPLNELSNLDEATTEDQHVALQLWWEHNQELFSSWFTSMTANEQTILLRKASPDMPNMTAGARELAGEKLAASDVLLPELSLEGLLGAEGKLLVLFFARRCQQADRAYFADIQLLNKMHANGVMPTFSAGIEISICITRFVYIVKAKTMYES
jgi:hypothetical protein